MVRTGTDGLQIPFPVLVKFLIVMGCKGIDLPFQIVGPVHEKNFFRNSACISVKFRIVLGLRDLSKILALSLRVKGKAFNFSSSISFVPSLKVVQTSLKSLMCVYGFSFSIPWKVGSKGTR